MNEPLYKRITLAAGAAALLISAGCMTYRESNTARTPEEQMLLTKAVDYSLADALPTSLVGRRVYLDVTNIDCVDKAYVADAVRQGLGAKGARLVDKASESDAVVTARVGMLATQSGTSLLGLPTIKVPALLTSRSGETPEIAVFKRATQDGLSKICLTAYDNDTKELIEARQGTARTRSDRWSILFVINFKRTNVPELKTPVTPQK
jgi:hypothetical protein